MTGLAERLSAVRARVREAARRSGRREDAVQLVAVSKKHSVEEIRAAYALGQRHFGENYMQELWTKGQALADLQDLRWHLIGNLQRNKAKFAVMTGALVETVDSLRLADALQRRALAEGRRVHVLLQVSLAGEAQKSGCLEEDLPALVAGLRERSSLQLDGLMTIPPAGSDPEHARPYFARLSRLARDNGLVELSMGMSADFEVAIEEGATMVRVGTAIFGPRPAAVPTGPAR